MKLKIVINGKSVEIDILENNLSIAFKYDNSTNQILEIITKVIQELKA
jgi:hypothetical protein